MYWYVYKDACIANIILHFDLSRRTRKHLNDQNFDYEIMQCRVWKHFFVGNLERLILIFKGTSKIWELCLISHKSFPYRVWPPQDIKDQLFRIYLYQMRSVLGPDNHNFWLLYIFWRYRSSWFSLYHFYKNVSWFFFVFSKIFFLIRHHVNNWWMNEWIRPETTNEEHLCRQIKYKKRNIRIYISHTHLITLFIRIYNNTYNTLFTPANAHFTVIKELTFEPLNWWIM